MVWADILMHGGQCINDSAERERQKGAQNHTHCPTDHPHPSLWDGPLRQALSAWGVGSKGLDIGAQAQNEGLKQIKILANVVKTSPKMYSNKQS